jgi:hypothetical protein
VAIMAEAGEISLQQKGFLKDLIVDQDKTILAVAETFDAENDLNDVCRKKNQMQSAVFDTKWPGYLKFSVLC